MKSTYGAAMTVTFMNAWNNYLWPTIILQDSNQITMPMLVANLKSGYSVDYGMLMLGVLICTLPTAIIFLCLQKEFCQWNCRSSEIMNRKYCLDKKNGRRRRQPFFLQNSSGSLKMPVSRLWKKRRAKEK